MNKFLHEIATTKSVNTYKTYKAAIDSYGVRGYTHGDLLEYIEEQQGLSSATIKQRLIILGCYFKFICVDTPEVMKVIADYKPEEKLQPCPTTEDVENVLDSLKDSKYRAVFLLACECGLRVSEIIEILMEDYNGKQIIIRGTKNHKDYKIILTTNAKKALEKYIKERVDSGPTLFTANLGKMSVSAIQHYIKRKLDYVGCGQYHMHSFRRYFANRLVQANVNPLVLQQCMRHKSFASTQKYLNIDGKQVADAVMGVFG